MIDFSGMTQQAIFAGDLAQVPDSYDKRSDSLIYTSLGPHAYSLSDFYFALNTIQQQGNIETAQGTALDNIVKLAGITRKQATAAVRLGIFNIAVPIGARFSTIDNALNYVVTAAVDGEPTQFQLTCETAGTVGNDYTGAILPITNVTGLTSALLTDILVPGQDTETDESLRARAIEQLTSSPFGGNIADYKAKILAIDGVGAVQVYPTWNGGGTVLCSILGADYAPASEELVQTVQNTIDPPPNQGLGYGTAPIGANVTITTATALTVNVSASLTLESGYEIGQVQAPVETAIQGYFTQIAQDWGTPVSGQPTGYSLSVYVSRVIAAILTVTGVVNATNVQLNGTANDITLTETSATQQISSLGTVTLSAV